MKNLYSLLAIVVLTILTSCSNESDAVNQPTTNPVDVYVTGKKNNIACYWKNNQVVMLDSAYSNTNMIKIMVSNANVHLLGKTNSHYSYWKNGVFTNLSNTFSDSAQRLIGITGMEVSGNDVYFVGYTKNPLITAEIYDLAYWKNGQKTIIAQNLNYIPQAFINVINSDVYISSQSTLSNAKYYKNGVAHNLAVGTHITGLTKKNNSVYLYGSNGSVAYYKNLDTEVETSIASIFSMTNLVFDGNDVYYIIADIVYKNNVEMPLNIQPVIGEPNSLLNFQKITVLNQNVYSIQSFSTLTSGFSIVGINNTNIFESNTTNEANSFSDIFVVQN